VKFRCDSIWAEREEEEEEEEEIWECTYLFI